MPTIVERTGWLGRLADSRESFFTDFSGTESPLSEGGVWQRTGSLWTQVDKSSGVAIGTQGNGGLFDDSYAFVPRFSPGSYRCDATIKKGAPSGTMEVEILGFFDDSPSAPGRPTFARGYECNYSFSGAYTDIRRWEGDGTIAISNYTEMNTNLGVTSPNDGDVLRADFLVTGQSLTINVYLNNVLKNTATDNPARWLCGGFGVAFYREPGSAASSEYGFHDFLVVKL